MKKKFIFLILLCGIVFFPENSSAQTVLNMAPISTSYFFNNNVEANRSSIQKGNFLGTDVYFENYADGSLFRAMSFNFQDWSAVQKQYFTVDFAIYSQFWTQQFKGSNAYIVDSKNNVSSCYADGSSNQNPEATSTSTTFITPVHCDNVFLEGSFRIVLSGVSSARGLHGLTTVTFKSKDNISSAIDKNTDEIKKGNEETKKQTDTIKDSDTTEASDSANSFFGDFESSDYGLSDIVTMPLEFIKKMSSSTCNSLEFPVPFVDQNVELPCMSSIYKKHFSSFLTLYQIITTGLIAYWCCVNMFRLVQNFKNPDNDEVEVLDL